MIILCFSDIATCRFLRHRYMQVLATSLHADFSDMKILLFDADDDDDGDGI